MATTYLTRQISSVGSRKKATISLWVKRGGGFDSDQRWFSYENTSVSNNITVFKFSGDSIQFADQTGGSNNARYDGTRKLRDPNSWYHFLVKMDTTQSTNTDRLKVYINGELQSEASYTYPTQNADLNIGHNANAYIDIGRWRGSNNQYFDGCISHFHYTDGYAYDASTFGSTDSTTGEWKINTSPTVTYGTNGFFILKDGNSVTDQSGQSNNFTVGAGTLTNSEDCPSNVFATLNPLQQNNTATTYSNGNTKGTGTSSSSNFSSTSATLAASSGKFYAEYKPNLSSTDSSISGFVNLDTANFNVTDFYGGSNNMSAGLFDSGGQILHSTGTNLGSVGALSNGDIVMLAMDLDNGYLYWGKNGTWFNSANPATSGGTGGLALSNLGSNGTYTFLNGNRKSMGTEWNFGNGFFGSTAISSEGTNASGIGKFEYDVPTGYTALSTKGLNE